LDDALHHTPLIATIVSGLVLAFIFGAVANRLRTSPIVGYLLAGVMVGPFTPGFVADQALAPELAELGVILLMFGVGMHFSLKDLLSVKLIAVPGAIGQIAVATAMGLALGMALGWSVTEGIVFGLALSVASTVVLIRALEDRHLIETPRGRIAVGWLIVEDLVMVLVLVLLPALARVVAEDPVQVEAGENVLLTLALTLGKVALFIGLMLVVGRRVIPWILHTTAHTGSRELFRLAVLAIALGVAYGASLLFDVSFALGAFFAGMVMAESELSHRAAEESLPLRDAFAVLFFVSVGMLFNPMTLWERPLQVLATLFIILIGKSVAAFLIVRAFGHTQGTALTIAASLAQIGEFSFILAGLGTQLNVLPAEGRDLIITGALLSIFANPAVFAVLDRRRDTAAAADATPTAVVAAAPVPADHMTSHAVVVGYGRVGSVVAARFRQQGHGVLAVETASKLIEGARAAGFDVIHGNAAQDDIIRACNLAAARWLMVAIPNAFEAGRVVQAARAINPELTIVARAHSDAEVEHLTKLGANTTVMGEREIAISMVEHALS
jgi:CPA2 family monovalent cation:H+ antiporter-2